MGISEFGGGSSELGGGSSELGRVPSVTPIETGFRSIESTQAHLDSPAGWQSFGRVPRGHPRAAESDPLQIDNPAQLSRGERVLQVDSPARLSSTERATRLGGEQVLEVSSPARLSSTERATRLGGEQVLEVSSPARLSSTERATRLGGEQVLEVPSPGSPDSSLGRSQQETAISGPPLRDPVRAEPRKSGTGGAEKASTEFSIFACVAPRHRGQ
jgi:hypothetical protein